MLYRADFLTGGLDYAKFLSENGEVRECEKVMLYILSNVKKGTDMGRVAAVVIDKKGPMSRMKRLMEQLIKRLGERRATLDSDGMELLAIVFFIAATNALEETDYAQCKYYCLCGMDVMPAHARDIRLENYLQLIRTCKEQSVADHPIMHTTQQEETRELTDPRQRQFSTSSGFLTRSRRLSGSSGRTGRQARWICARSWAPGGLSGS